MIDRFFQRDAPVLVFVQLVEEHCDRVSLADRFELSAGLIHVDKTITVRVNCFEAARSDLAGDVFLFFSGHYILHLLSLRHARLTIQALKFQPGICESLSLDLLQRRLKLFEMLYKILP